MKLFRVGVPILLVAGAIGGIAFVVTVTRKHYATLAMNDRDACRTFTGDDTAKEVSKKCAATAKACRHAREDYVERVTMHPGELRPRDWPEGLPLSNTRANAMQFCLHEHRDAL